MEDLTTDTDGPLGMCLCGHLCSCGHGPGPCHEAGAGDCPRLMLLSKPIPCEGGWIMPRGEIITDYTLRFQRYGAQHSCGCWSYVPYD